MAEMVAMPTTDGLFGSGGGGLIGGLILGSLLRNNGNLFGGNGGDAAVGALATANGVNSSINQSQMQTQLADIKASIPFNESQVQLALAGQTSNIIAAIDNSSAQSALRDSNAQAAIATGFGNQNLALANSLAAITSSVNQVGNQVQAGTYATAENIRNDGDKTRALLTAQYEATLNRQLTDANAEIIALQNRQASAEAARGVEVSTTNNINMMQQQQQQQQQYSQLASLIWNLGQSIRSTNEAINVGTGTQTASPVNTNTNIR